MTVSYSYNRIDYLRKKPPRYTTQFAHKTQGLPSSTALNKNICERSERQGAMFSPRAFPPADVSFATADIYSE
jgi:hypothetical protein